MKIGDKLYYLNHKPVYDTIEKDGVTYCSKEPTHWDVEIFSDVIVGIVEITVEGQSEEHYPNKFYALKDDTEDGWYVGQTHVAERELDEEVDGFWFTSREKAEAYLGG